MEKWKGKIAVVTGASAGIGISIVKSLVSYGVHVIGLARRVEKVEELVNELQNADGKVYAYKCDVADQQSVAAAFQWMEEKFGGVDILINNAGVYKFMKILDDGETVNDDLKQTVDVNLMGVVYCTRAAFATMKNREFSHIIHMNSIGGHFVPFPSDSSPFYNIYCASKYGITATNEVLRQELALSEYSKKIRVTSISPGEVKTEMVAAAGGDAEKYYETIPFLLPEDVAESVIYVLSTPARVNVTEVIIRPTGERI
ncbi:hypothetical protein PVAND_008021 [Polypedilum vanderplanki]|uniref:Dehydrogenase n=1 Tax=Polypedilum vanderplanki TaxID=319348 RepID=A0A9J6C8Y2_POLVA|nr:hypothetical protein PVAND_008021 [Polypedilum vanderplanki]